MLVVWKLLSSIMAVVVNSLFSISFNFACQGLSEGSALYLLIFYSLSCGLSLGAGSNLLAAATGFFDYILYYNNCQ